MKKRILSVLLCALLVVLPAFAETAQQPAVSYRGVWKTIDGPAAYDFQVYLPAAWKVDELSGNGEGVAESYDPDQQISYPENVYYVITGGHGVWGMTVGWTEREESVDAAALQAESAETFADAAVVSINGFDFVRYTDAEQDAIVLLLPEEGGVHEFALLPASDADFTPWAEEIIPTITVVQTVEE